MRSFKADLHVHTVLSPCADLLNTPGKIIERALEQQIDLLAITDHNSAENVAVTMELAKSTPLQIIPGMEVESVEEVHLLCLFDHLTDLLSWQEIVYASLPDLKNDEEFFGDQLLTDLTDEYVGKVDRMLAAATKMSVSEIVKAVKKLAGIVIPAHIDRPYNSIIANLGFIPSELGLSIVEVSARADLKKTKENYPFLRDYYFIKDTDSHYLESLQPMMEFWMEEVKLSELVKAIKGQQGRSLKYL